MTSTVEIPLWVFLIIAGLGLLALLAFFLLPSGRWFFRRRANLLIDELNRRLDIQLPSFALTRRQVLIDRLVYDPQVLDAVSAICEEQNIARDVVMARVERYAKEIVPSFNAYVYFRLGSFISRTLARLLYRVRLGYMDAEGLEAVDRRSSVVLVMNHRSNMDYVLVAFLALNRTALSYAVGEWARVWPVQQLARGMGAYFVRRGSGDPLYRRALERYVQMAVEGGVVQAIFPEGRLTRDGHLQEPRIGLLDYMLRGFDSEGKRDLVFIPVSLNYDRVLEDRSLLLMDHSEGEGPERRGKFSAIATTLRFIAHNLWLMLRGRWYRFGYACANFGTPISMRAWLAENNLDLRSMEKEERYPKVVTFANHLMDRIARLMPALPVSLVSSIMLESGGVPVDREWIRECALERMMKLEGEGARVYMPRNDPRYTVEVGLRMLILRHLVTEADGHYRIEPSEEPLLRYYANALSAFPGSVPQTS